MAGTDSPMAAAGGHKFPEGRHALRLGDSYFGKSAPTYHTMRYDFKPASVGDCKETYVEVAENQETTVTVPKLDETGEVRDATVFKGPRKPYQKECLLIYNHETGEFVLEQLHYSYQLKKTRGEVTDDVLKGIRETRKKLMHSMGNDTNAFNGASSSSSSSSMIGQVSSTRQDVIASSSVGPSPGGSVINANTINNSNNNNHHHHEGGDAEMMSDSGGSGSESDSSSDGEGSDDDDGDAHSDNEPTNMDNGQFSEDELAKSLEAELAPSSQEQLSSTTAVVPSSSSRVQVNHPSQPPQAQNSGPSRLHEDLLLSESSDDED